MKAYDLDVRPIRENGSSTVICYLSKGHHDPAAFLDEVDFLARNLRGTILEHRRVQHLWYRVTPGGEDGGMIYTVADGVGRGAFPVTVMEVF